MSHDIQQITSLFFKGLTKSNDFEDISDLICGQLTPRVMAFFATLSILFLYIISPVTCYMATDIGGKNLDGYVQSYCWVRGTNFIRAGQYFPQTASDWQAIQLEKILYYTWIPFILVFQCLLLILPKMFWKSVSQMYYGISLNDLMKVASGASNSPKKDREKMIKQLANSIGTIIFENLTKNDNHQDTSDATANHNTNDGTCIQPKIFPLDPRKNPLQLVYLLVKLFYFAAAYTQLFVLQKLINPSRSMASHANFPHHHHSNNFFRITGDLMRGYEDDSIVFKNPVLSADRSRSADAAAPRGYFNASSQVEYRRMMSATVFPKFTFCHVPIRHLGAVDNAVVAQCTLPMNMLNERMFLFAWYWLMLLCALALASLPVWIDRFLFHKTGYITSILNSNHHRLVYLARFKRRMDWKLVQFERLFFQHDAWFILKMMERNAGYLVVEDVVCRLWMIHRQYHLNLNTAELESNCLQLGNHISLKSIDNGIPSGLSSPGGKSAEKQSSADARTTSGGGVSTADAETALKSTTKRKVSVHFYDESTKFDNL